MNRNPDKLKRIHSKTNEKVSITQKRIRNENEKRRRDLFNKLITNLGEVISGKSNDQTKLSKNSILRQTVSYLREHKQHLPNECKMSLSSSKLIDILNFSWKPSCEIINICEWFQIAIESMNCFLLIVNSNKIIYVSENINCYLGYSQDEILNKSLFEFILSSDHDQLNDYLKDNHQVLKKCFVSWKQSIKNEYEQCTIFGAFRKINENDKYLISIVQLNPLDRTLVLNNQYSKDEQFVIHINNSGRFIFINSKAQQFLGYNSFELIGQNFFHFVHPDDFEILVRAHQLWKQNGNGKSDPYRFLTKGQQWIFLQTFSQVQINSWTGKAEYYICTTNLLQCSNYSWQKQCPTSNSDVVECSPVLPRRISLGSNSEEKVRSSENEITSFLSHLDNENHRKNVREKLIELRKSKEAEIRVRQDEIQVIEDIIQFIDQYQIKHSTNIQTKNLVSEEILLNVFDTNCDLTLFNSPLTNPIEDFSLQPNSLTDSLFSPLSTTFNVSSPINLPSINDPIQEINSFPTTNNSFI